MFDLTIVIPAATFVNGIRFFTLLILNTDESDEL